MTIDMQYAKDGEGEQGHRFTCTWADLARLPRSFDLYQELWDFTCEARPVRGTVPLIDQGRFV